MTTTEIRYSMKEIKEKTGLSDHTLRYYEKDGILPDIKRKENGRRVYEAEDLYWLEFVLCLRATGMPLQTIRQYRELIERGEETAAERRQLLMDQRENLLDQIETLQKSLSRLNRKIDHYDMVCRGKKISGC